MRARSRRGSSILETGPSLFILFVFVLFPLLDMVSMLLQYCAGWYLNSLSAHEVACLRQFDPVSGASNWQPALNLQAQNFCNTGIGAFLRLKSNQITQNANPVAGSTPPAVVVNTSMPIQPLLIIPMPTPIPGLNQPFNVTYTMERQREDTR